MCVRVPTMSIDNIPSIYFSCRHAKRYVKARNEREERRWVLAEIDMCIPMMCVYELHSHSPHSSRPHSLPPKNTTSSRLWSCPLRVLVKSGESHESRENHRSYTYLPIIHYDTIQYDTTCSMSYRNCNF